MVRSMYSGVSGLRSHQTRMDTIGNNIANVNTYGFKSGRTTFRDIYYQQIRSASEPTAAAGGMNPSAVGYGSKVGSVDLMMSRSTFTMTDQTMDLAIDGDGFFQVQDGAGNTYYTRAGMLNFDASGNLVDMQGNFVLGVNGNPSGRAPSSERIQVNLDPVPPTAAQVVQTINGREYTISASEFSTDGNMNFNFTTDANLADGQVVASISTSGIIIRMNPENQYRNWGELNDAVNAAILRANNNNPHPGGTFTIAYTGDPALDPMASGTPLSAADITSTNFGITPGRVTFGANNQNKTGLTPSGNVGNTFGQSFVSDPPQVTSFTSRFDNTGGAGNEKWVFDMVIDGQTYRGEVPTSRNVSGRVKLVNTNGQSEDDYIEMSRPSFDQITERWQAENVALGTPEVPATKAVLPIDFNEYSGGTTPLAVGDKVAFAFDGGLINREYTIPNPVPGGLTPEAWLQQEIIANPPTGFTAAAGAGNTVVFTAATAGRRPAYPTFKLTQAAGGAVLTGAVDNSIQDLGTDFQAYIPPTPTNGAGFTHNTADLGNPTVRASAASRALGFSGTSFALRGGTSGGPQTIADMTGISIAPNGIITGFDSIGREVIIGRIDLATFANPSGLNQAGSSNYTVSSNSGDPILNQPGMGGAGKLVGGSLELSNVDLSREFSDMITTQRGYQANSRIITVSDTMLEELINLKR